MLTNQEPSFICKHSLQNLRIIALLQKIHLLEIIPSREETTHAHIHTQASTHTYTHKHRHTHTHIGRHIMKTKWLFFIEENKSVILLWQIQLYRFEHAEDITMHVVLKKHFFLLSTNLKSKYWEECLFSTAKDQKYVKKWQIITVINRKTKKNEIRKRSLRHMK